MTLSYLLLGVCFAQEATDDDVLPVPERSVEEPRRGPDRSQYEALGEMQKLFEMEQQGRRASESQILDLQQRLREAAEAQAEEAGVQLPAASGEASESELEGSASSTRSRSARGEASREDVESKPAAAFLRGLKPKVGSKVGQGGTTAVDTGPRAIVFDVPESGTRKVQVLPAGSYVKARIMTGVEADDRTLIPMMLQADYAALGPNGHRVDLTGCMLIAQAKGQLSTDRVVGKAVRLSCVRDDSQIIDVEVDGYLAGEDSTLGVVGQLISRQGRVLAAATIANLAKGAGEAIAAANTTSSLVASPLTGATGEVQNVTGNSTAYVAGSSVAGAAEDVADWYLSYAEKLTPAIAVGSGRDVWIVMLKSVEFAGLEAR